MNTTKKCLLNHIQITYCIDKTTIEINRPIFIKQNLTFK